MIASISLQILSILALASSTQALPSNGKASCSAAELHSRVIKALGGPASLDAITSITLRSSSYRTTTLTQNYDLVHSDQPVAESGAQNVTFQFGADGVLHQRIDRKYQFGDYWIWAFPDLNPKMEFSLVVQSGSNASACFNKGQNSFYAFGPPKAHGFADPMLTDYLVKSAEQLALPYILKTFKQRLAKLTAGTTFEKVLGVRYATIHDADLDLTLLIDESTFLPYAIRSREQHKVFGPSTSDIIFGNFTAVPSQSGNMTVRLPHRIQTVYNNEFVLEDFVVDTITLNPSLSTDFFAAAPPADADFLHPMGPPKVIDEFTRSDVHEFFEAGLWSGPMEQYFNTSSVVVKPVFPNGTTSEKIKALYVGYADYVQLLIEFEDGLLITDAPAHRSKIVLDWVTENMKGKKITHVVPSHHHRDHAGGVGDFLAAGATLVIPEVAKSFYSHINGGKFKIQTYAHDHPFTMQDKNVKFQSYWHEDSSHARDWTYATASARCPKSNDTDFVVYNVDVVNPGPGAVLRTDITHAREFLLSAIADGVPKTATLVASHGYTPNGLGTQDSLENISQLVGVTYPEKKADNHKC